MHMNIDASIQLVFSLVHVVTYKFDGIKVWAKLSMNIVHINIILQTSAPDKRGNIIGIIFLIFP